MATAETVQMGPAHPPKAESIKAFDEIHVDLKKTLQHLRHDTNKHEPEYFKAVAGLSDHQLMNFTSEDLKEVRIATSAYGMHLFGKVLIPDSGAYFMFRAFVPGDAETATLHCIHMQETEMPGGDKVFKAIFSQDDKLEWFDM